MTNNAPTEILILFDSKHGSTAELANYINRGVESVNGMQSRIRTVAPVSAVTEVSQDDIPEQGPLYATLEDLKECAGVIFGSPAYFGNMSASLKYFIDSTTPLWLSGALINKPAAVFTSSSSYHGGQESVLLSMMQPLLHHGMLLVGIPYSEAALNTTTTGGTPYGASHITGINHDLPFSDDEKNLAKALGKRVAEVALALGRAQLNDKLI